MGIPLIDPKKPEDLRLRLATEGVGSLIEGEKGAMDGGGRALRVVVWLGRREGLDGVVEAVSRVEPLLRYTVRMAFPYVSSSADLPSHRRPAAVALVGTLGFWLMFRSDNPLDSDFILPVA